MWTLLLIFACKRPKYADTGGRGCQKTVKFCGRPLFMDGHWPPNQLRAIHKELPQNLIVFRPLSPGVRIFWLFTHL